MKIYIGLGERYPDYDIDYDDTWRGGAVEVTQETHDRWVAAINLYEEVQGEMEEARNSAIESRKKATG